MPDGGTLKITESIVYNIPISRWYDILFAFLAVNIYGWVLRGLRLTTKDYISDNDFFIGFGVGLVASLAVGLVAGLVASLVVGLVVGLGAGLAFIVRTLFFMNFWNKIGHWLIARDLS
ncbi:hypothetical protein A2661_02310 [Candidatus Giovannonibacteria bacterium RIFCSPHIGHO2_01_FULL_45_24]|nr:MAG: hypothetical protein A2661_02310 [Candidatus Giovannonibacteria bacterium RIFCSPHIGHO2_01_FULL_45_24]